MIKTTKPTEETRAMDCVEINTRLKLTIETYSRLNAGALQNRITISEAIAHCLNTGTDCVEWSNGGYIFPHQP